jgi:hypothetical protein
VRKLVRWQDIKRTGDRRHGIVLLLRGEQIASGVSAKRWHCGEKLLRGETIVIGNAVWKSMQFCYRTPPGQASVLDAEPESSAALHHYLVSMRQVLFKASKTKNNLNYI